MWATPGQKEKEEKCENGQSPHARFRILLICSNHFCAGK
jgi:hypothetical protein